jgi:cytochrome P450
MVQVVKAPKAQSPVMPIARGLPLLGPIPGLIHQKLDYLHQARQRYGDIYLLKLPGVSMIVLNHPDHAQHVLQTNGKNYSKEGPIWEAVRAIAGNGLATSSGDFWLRQRRMMQPHFHRQRVQELAKVMSETIQECLEQWYPFANQSTPLDITHKFSQMTMMIITRTMLGSDMSDDETHAIGEKMAYIAQYLLFQTLTRSIPKWIPVPTRTEFQQTLHEVREFIYGVIEKRRQQQSNDLLSMLIGSLDGESGEQMSDQQLFDEAMTIFGAGFETTAITLSWALYFLTKAPDCMERLQAEVDTVLGQREPTFEDLPALPYTRQIFQETMRLYPPLAIIPREAIEDDEIAGHRIPAGQMVSVTPYTIHRHPEFWQSPDVFDPDRFAPQNQQNHYPMAWLPFGGGQRACIGREFAYMEGVFILAMIMQRFTLSAPADFITKSRLALTPHPESGVLIYLKPR